MKKKLLFIPIYGTTIIYDQEFQYSRDMVTGIAQ